MPNAQEQAVEPFKRLFGAVNGLYSRVMAVMNMVSVDTDVT